MKALKRIYQLDVNGVELVNDFLDSVSIKNQAA